MRNQSIPYTQAPNPRDTHHHPEELNRVKCFFPKLQHDGHN